MDMKFKKILKEANEELNVEQETADEYAQQINSQFSRVKQVSGVSQIQKDIINEHELEGEQAVKAYHLGVKVTIEMFQIRHEDKMKQILPGNLGKMLGGGVF